MATSPSVDIVNYIIYSAINNRTSDIHIDPDDKAVNIYFRIDGQLRLYKSLGLNLRDAVVSKIKVQAKMNIAEHRYPEDGHIQYKYNNFTYNIRVSSLPTIYGESLVLRILNRGDNCLELDKLGLEEDQLRLLKEIITMPNGMLLITGPTGSGKTNLLYSIINYLNKPEKKIVTLEDPVEFQLPGIRQTQINEEINYTFAKAMRAVVRQDPNIIMLGEIRDADTVQMAIQAALIGIMVLSTFHTFDIPALVSRLVEMGSTPSVIAQSLIGVISSRLVRRICPQCRQNFPVDPTIAKDIGTQINSLPKGVGCDNCKNTGYFGRIGIYEVVKFDDEIKNSIIAKSSPQDINEIIRKKNYISLKEAAVKKVLAGITTVEEIKRVVGGII